MSLEVNYRDQVDLLRSDFFPRFEEVSCFLWHSRKENVSPTP